MTGGVLASSGSSGIEAGGVVSPKSDLGDARRLESGAVVAVVTVSPLETR